MTDRSEITLYSGGHKGAESEFGRLSERWGIQEVNFSFEGHTVERTRGVQVLGPEELDRGDVSMEIVSARMGRNYSKAEKIRKVIQTIFHMVNNGYHVIVLGWIQPDDTVKGGTGWGVELAKLFNRPVHVFDQDGKEWYTGRTTSGSSKRRSLPTKALSVPGPATSPTMAAKRCSTFLNALSARLRVHA